MINRKNEIIKSKGFKMDYPVDTQASENQSNFVPVDFSKIKVGTRTLDDAVLDLGLYQSANKRLSQKDYVIKSIYNNDKVEMRTISNFFYKTSGIYSRLCNYMARMYRYDWMITPYINEEKNGEKEQNNILQEFYKILLFFDNSDLKRLFGKIALRVVKDGCYYGYLQNQEKRIIIQELPINYCRSRFENNNRPVVEFDMHYFDTFKDVTQKIKILKMFGPDFTKGYKLFKEGKLLPQFDGDSTGWYLLDPEYAIKFNINEQDYPLFMAVIPAIIDLDEAKDLDKKKMAQELLKIIIQKMPIDKNGDLVFDVEEARELHNNAVFMLKKAIGIDVLTTFADVEVADMSDNRTTAASDDLERVERAVYNEAGVSQMQFNTDGNLALEKSILNDVATFYDLILQFQAFMNDIIEKKYNKRPKKCYYRAQILTTTIYNYQEMAKLYKEQMQVGFSKMLPQIALGQSQSAILANAYFENKVLDLVNVFIPPMMSSTMNSDVLNRLNNETKKNDSESTGGRPEKSDDEKSEKTIMNEESKS